FAGVTEETLNSIFRRTAVCKYKSVFVDEVRIAGKQELAARHGIFPRDPTLKDFLRDGPACLVTLRCLWNYARSRTAFQCRDVLEKYVVRGGDGGLTLATVRRSCGLTPDETATADPVQETLESLMSKEPSGETGRSNQDVSQAQAMIAAHRDEEKQTVQQLRQWLCEERKDWFTLNQLKTAKSKFVFNFSKQEAQNVIENMVKQGKIISAPITLPKVGQTTIFLPTYSCEKALGDVVPLKHDQNLVFTEEYNVERVYTTDYDVASSMFTIVVQLFDLVKPADCDIPSWRAVAKVANGASHDKFEELNKQAVTFLKALSNESRLLRWLACSQMQAEYGQLRRHSKNNWPEASIFAAWWNPAEDHILQVMLEEVQQHGFGGHISCHFDGLLLSTSMVKSIETATGKNMILVLQEAVQRNTRFEVAIKNKTLPSFDVWLSNKLRESDVDADLGTYRELLTATPNSIPAAITFLGADLKQVVSRLRKESPSNAKADTHCVRQYSDWHGCGDLYLVPRHACVLNITKDFLLHLELPESSLCLGVKVVTNDNILVMRAGKVYEGTMAQLMDLLESYHGTKQTFFFDIASEDPDLDDVEIGFLDLLAGSSSIKKRPASIRQHQDPQNDGEVDVGAELRRLLCDEVTAAIRATQARAGNLFPPTVCPCCPWRQFERRRCLVEHLQHQHTEAKRFCPAGTKQLRVVVALYDHDRLHDRTPQPTFLARASELLRKTVKGNMPRNRSFIDKSLRCVFHSDGPEFVNIRSITEATGLRRVGNLFYDRGFADAFLNAAAAHHASLHKIQAYFLEKCRRDDGKLASVIPRGNNGFWMNVLEDLMMSPLLEAYTAGLMDRCAVLHVASDAPSAELFQTLKEVLPNLQSLSLDAMHIVMVYDQNMNNRRTAGSKWLAVIMNKFRKRHSSRTQASFGEFYNGGTLGSAPQDVKSMRDCLLEPDMSENAARTLLETLDPDTPWLTEVDFLQALVAHFSFFREELRKVTFTGVSLHRLIVNVASPAKFQWLLNDTRYRHSVHRQELVLLPSGTTSNESLHHEVNVWFRETAT
ncbi:unnamed protein product, partial [Symbiodinium necroappetens]